MGSWADRLVLAVAGALELPAVPLWWLHEALRAQVLAFGVDPERAFMVAWPVACVADALGSPGWALRRWWLGRRI